LKYRRSIKDSVTSGGCVLPASPTRVGIVSSPTRVLGRLPSRFLGPPHSSRVLRPNPHAVRVVTRWLCWYCCSPRVVGQIIIQEWPSCAFLKLSCLWSRFIIEGSLPARPMGKSALNIFWRQTCRPNHIQPTCYPPVYQLCFASRNALG